MSSAVHHDNDYRKKAAEVSSAAILAPPPRCAGNHHHHHLRYRYHGEEAVSAAELHDGAAGEKRERVSPNNENSNKCWYYSGGHVVGFVIKPVFVEMVEGASCTLNSVH